MAESLVAADLGDAAFGGDVAVQDDKAAGFLQRLVGGDDHFLAGSFMGRGGFFGDGFAGDRDGVAVEQPEAEQAAGEEANASGGVHVGGDEAAGGFQVGEDRGALADGLEIVDVERDSGLARNGQQVQHGVGGAAGGGHRGDGIFEGVGGEDIQRANSAAKQVHHHLAALQGDFFFLRRERGNAVEAHRRKADQLHHGGHGVGRVLAAAGSGAGTGDVFQGLQLVIADLAGGVGAHGLEDILNGDVLAFVAAGGDGAAVEDEAGNVEAGQGHGRAGNGFVAADDADHGVEELAAADQFDGVGDDLRG